MKQVKAGERHFPRLDLFVSHDMTVFALRDRLLGELASDFPVDFLDGLIIYQKSGKRFLKSHHGEPKEI